MVIHEHIFKKFGRERPEIGTCLIPKDEVLELYKRSSEVRRNLSFMSVYANPSYLKRYTLLAAPCALPAESYRTSIGAERNCKILITGRQDSGRMIGVLPGVVSGSNCPNGNLLNIGVKPENEEANFVPEIIRFRRKM